MNTVPTATMHPGFILSIIDRLARPCPGLTDQPEPRKGTPTIARRRGGGWMLHHPGAALTAPISP